MPAPGTLRFQKSADDRLTMDLAGNWKLGRALPTVDVVRQRIEDLLIMLGLLVLAAVYGCSGASTPKGTFSARRK